MAQLTSDLTLRPRGPEIDSSLNPCDFFGPEDRPSILVRTFVPYREARQPVPWHGILADSGRFATLKLRCCGVIPVLALGPPLGPHRPFCRTHARARQCCRKGSGENVFTSFLGLRLSCPDQKASHEARLADIKETAPRQGRSALSRRLAGRTQPFVPRKPACSLAKAFFRGPKD